MSYRDMRDQWDKITIDSLCGYVIYKTILLRALSDLTLTKFQGYIRYMAHIDKSLFLNMHETLLLLEGKWVFTNETVLNFLCRHLSGFNDWRHIWFRNILWFSKITYSPHSTRHKDNFKSRVVTFYPKYILHFWQLQLKL